MLKTLRNLLVHNWFRLRRSMTLGVRVVAITDDGRVCLVRHTYTPGWHFPGGGVERGETCLDAAIKEACEEAGLVIAHDDITLRSIHTNFENFSGDHVTVFIAKKWTCTPTNVAHEIAESGFFPLNELPEGTTGGTRRRLAEINGGPISLSW